MLSFDFDFEVRSSVADERCTEMAQRAREVMCFPAGSITNSYIFAYGSMMTSQQSSKGRARERFDSAMAVAGIEKQ